MWKQMKKTAFIAEPVIPYARIWFLRSQNDGEKYMKKLMKGNEALAEGAVRGGAMLFAG